MSDPISRLATAGYRPATMGDAILTGSAYALYRLWSAYLERWARGFGATPWQAPLIIERATLEKTGYLEHFPQQLFSSHGYVEQAGEHYLTPAACLHLYPRLSGKELRGAVRTGYVLAPCARYEGGKWQFPFRLASFHMAELVAVGRQSELASLYEQVERQVVKMFGGFGLPGKLRVATDAFFLGNDEGAKVIQKLKELKKEYLVTVGGQEVALASLNRHETYFSRRFELAADSEPEAHSFCAAFGIERLVAASLLVWGDRKEGWPEELAGE